MERICCPFKSSSVTEDFEILEGISANTQAYKRDVMPKLRKNTLSRKTQNDVSRGRGRTPVNVM